jgi:peptidoglycan/LPS O-acetylase OafA/YrhL
MILLLLILSGLHLAHVPGYVVSQKTGGLGRALLAALPFHIGYLEATRDYLPGNWDILWSLSVEEMFYLFFPLAARLFRKQVVACAASRSHCHCGAGCKNESVQPQSSVARIPLTGGNGCDRSWMSHGHVPRRQAALVSRDLHLWRGWSGLLIFSLGLSIQGYKWGLGRNGLNFTILAVGVCLLIAAASQSSWRSPRVLSPLLIFGQRSYEIYLTHMFAVLALFAAFVHFGKPVRGVPVLFIFAIVAAGVLGWGCLRSLCRAHEPLHSAAKRH